MQIIVQGLHILNMASIYDESLKINSKYDIDEGYFNQNTRGGYLG